MSHLLKLCMILSYLIFYNFILLSLFVLLLYFYHIKFVCFLLSTTPHSYKMGDWEGDGGGSIFLQFSTEKVRLHYLFSR